MILLQISFGQMAKIPIPFGSLYSSICKNENIYKKELIKFLWYTIVIHMYMFDFRQIHSIKYTLIDSNKFACGIFGDLQNFFGTVNYKYFQRNYTTTVSTETKIFMLLE